MTALTMPQEQLDAIRWHAGETATAYTNLGLPPSQAAQDRQALLGELDTLAQAARNSGEAHLMMGEGIRDAIRADRDHGPNAGMSIITNYADAAGLLDALDERLPTFYVNRDDGYHWLTCGRCEEPLLQVDAGTSLPQMNKATWAHECTTQDAAAGEQ
ncbi:hypothetical protein [Streptosporangium sp. H16]|uniref:hypothetical protein n=1 Tax=Streptosporangium sp. H16 TaxID=3444184 RepID=UPI003F793D45